MPKRPDQRPDVFSMVPTFPEPIFQAVLRPIRWRINNNGDYPLRANRPLLATRKFDVLRMVPSGFTATTPRPPVNNTATARGCGSATMIAGTITPGRVTNSLYSSACVVSGTTNANNASVATKATAHLIISLDPASRLFAHAGSSLGLHPPLFRPLRWLCRHTRPGPNRRLSNKRCQAVPGVFTVLHLCSKGIRRDDDNTVCVHTPSR